MTKPIWAASYELGVELAAAGCPLDYLDALRDDSAAAGKSFWAKQLCGYAESCVYVLGESLTGFVIGLRLGTSRGGGTIITEWNFVPPWPEHHICWDYQPTDIIPKPGLGNYRSVLDSRLPGILNERRMLRRGYPVEGLLCGYSDQPVPESGEGLVSGKLRLVDENGNIVSLSLDLRIVRAAATRSRRNLRSRRSGLLEKVDQIPVGSKRV
jgi:hypothetical protein